MARLAAREFGVRPRDLRNGRIRSGPVVSARRAIIHASASFGANRARIGRTLGLNWRTVEDHLRQPAPPETRRLLMWATMARYHNSAGTI